LTARRPATDNRTVRGDPAYSSTLPLRRDQDIDLHRHYERRGYRTDRAEFAALSTADPRFYDAFFAVLDDLAATGKSLKLIESTVTLSSIAFNARLAS
jgi:hypothetical protein